jgi:hypothetical protein
MSGPAYIENVLYPTFDTCYIIPFKDEHNKSYSTVLQYIHQSNYSNNDIFSGTSLSGNIPRLFYAQQLKFNYHHELKEALINTSGPIIFPFLQDQLLSNLNSKVLECLRAYYKQDSDFEERKEELGL